MFNKVEASCRVIDHHGELLGYNLIAVKSKYLAGIISVLTNTIDDCECFANNNPFDILDTHFGISQAYKFEASRTVMF